MSQARIMPMKEWNSIPWRKLERKVFKLQKRIFQASLRDDVKTVHQLQRLLMRSWSAKCLAVRQVTQDNTGKNTAGVDGIKSLTPMQRLKLVETLKLSSKATPVRRVWIPKPNSSEKRGLGIPTIYDRALQGLVKVALEPEWEARFEPHSYGFRPGRSCQDAIEAIFNAIRWKAKYVLDADICKCFDKINHNALLGKLNTFPQLYRQIRAWLKAGMMEGKTLFPTSEGTPQGGTASPILANIALHGLSQLINKISPKARLIRYCDDFVVLHEELQVIHQCQSAISLWLEDMGLSLKPSKTHISHTLKPYQGRVGFDFLGFTVRQFSVGKYQCGKIGCKGNNPKPLGFKTLIKPSHKALKRQVEKVGNIINAHRSANSQRLIQRLNPIIRGWARYYSTVVSKASFEKLDNLVYQQLRAWARRRHSNKSAHWRVSKYWRTVGGDRWYFATTIENKIMRLFKYRETPIRRHIKVKGNRSPYDGDWIYWSTRQGRHPQTPTRVAKLLKQQQGKCSDCGLYFQDKDKLEVDHIIPISHGGKDIYPNLQLLHRHCHVTKSRVERNHNLDSKGMCDKHQISEEPNKPKGLRSVLKTSREGNFSA